MARRLEVEIVGDASSLKRALGQANSGFKGSIGQWVKGGLVLGGVQKGMDLLGQAVKGGISEWQESQKVTAQTNAVLKSTGKTANVTTKQITNLAESIMLKSGVDDEAIQSGENLLLTFTNIRNEVGKNNDIFNQATEASVDMAVALGTEPKRAAMQLGKALNDPIKGITALTRVGVSFTEGQKEQIKSMVAHGNTVGAQKLILKELNKEFGGSAEAAGKTLPGQLNILKERFNNFSGELVAKTIPVIKQVIEQLRDHWPEIQREFNQMVKGMRPAFEDLKVSVRDLTTVFQENKNLIVPIMNLYKTIVINTFQTMAAVIRVFTSILRGDFRAAWENVKTIFRNALENIKAILTTGITVYGNIAKALGKAILQGVIDGLNALDDLLRRAVTGLFHKVIDWVKGVLGIKSPSSVFAEIGKNMIRGMVGGIGSMGGYLKDAVVRLAKSVPGRVLDVVRGSTPGAPNMGGLDPRVANAVIVAGQRGWHGTVTSGFRSRAEQSALYARYLAGGPLAARPGTSSHERGEAVDVTDYQTFGRIMAQLPSSMRLYNRLGAIDPVHYSVSGYAKGGIFNRPTLGVIGEAGPEAVIPLGRGGGRPMQVNLQLDGRTLASILVDPLRNELRQVQRAGGTF